MDKTFKLTFKDNLFVASTRGTDTLQLLVSTASDEHPPQLSMSTYGKLGSKDKVSEQCTWLIENLKPGDKFQIEYDDSARPTEPYERREIGPLIEHCTFCGKSKNEVDILIEGSKFLRGHICNSCVVECTKVINEERRKRGKDS